MNALLRVESVAKSFGGRRVLSSASLRAVPGELRVLFGRNGIGKSTLLKIAAGCVAPDGGTVHFGAHAYLHTRLPTLVAAGLFYLPDADLLSSAFTVRQQLTLFQHQFGGDAIDEAAARVGISARLDHRPDTLPGGERRRAELAAVLVRRPTCLLADEPYRGLAPQDAEVLTTVLRALAASGVAVLVTGHEVPTLLDAADHITWCTSGTTYELGPPAVAVQHEAFQREYVGPWRVPRDV
jgi:ABC-type multidrug transport system ATPase subunit